jgi:hypothetical protein
MHCILFRTDQFNLRQVGGHFINDCCFGEDLAEWLSARLRDEGNRTEKIYQEDWGWEIRCTQNDRGYYLGVSGAREGDDSDYGEWRIMITKRRSLLEAFLGKERFHSGEPIVQGIYRVLREAAFENIHEETES